MENRTTIMIPKPSTGNSPGSTSNQNGIAQSCDFSAALEAIRPDPGVFATAEEAERKREAVYRAADVERVWRSSGVYLGNDESRHSIIARTQPDWERVPAWTTKFKSFRDYVRGRMIFLAGPRGTGKTQLALSLAWSWLHQQNGPRSFIYVVAEKMIRQIQEAIGDGAKSAALERYARADLLIIDEEDRRIRSESADRTFGELWDARYQFRKTTLVISNRSTVEEIQQAIGESAYSRLCEAGGIAWCKWGNFR